MTRRGRGGRMREERKGRMRREGRMGGRMGGEKEMEKKEEEVEEWKEVEIYNLNNAPLFPSLRVWHNSPEVASVQRLLVSQMVPHCPLKHISTIPSFDLFPASLVCPSWHPYMDNDIINDLICTGLKLPFRGQDMSVSSAWVHWGGAIRVWWVQLVFLALHITTSDRTAPVPGVNAAPLIARAPEMGKCISNSHRYNTNCHSYNISPLLSFIK